MAEGEQNKRAIYYDHLLDLPNGKKMAEDLASFSAFEHAALIHFDIDTFAGVNELYGWDAGDYLLIQVRDWLLATLRPTSRLYRVKDDAFCLLIRDISLQQAKARAREVLRRFSKPWELPRRDNGFPLFCRIKLGVVYGKTVQGDIRNLLYRTLNAPDRQGRGYVLYDEAMDRQIQKDMRLRQTLINCVQQNMQGFAVHYQPIIEAQTGQWVGAEALCRWTTPQGVAVPPRVFIADAEQLGLIDRVDDWVRHTAMRQCRAWGLTEKTFFLDINLSPTRAVDKVFIKKILAEFRELDYPKNKLNLELTESAKVDFSGPNLKGLCRLNAEGVLLSLDDFGTGYSSFNNLINIPATALKTERAFIKDLETNHYLQYLLQVMVHLAHHVGMKLIAEGVETPAQKELLQAYGVDYMQGYLFSRPLPASAFEKQVGRYAC